MHKTLRLRWDGYVERMQNQRMPKHIATATKERRGERRRPRKRCRKADENLNIKGIKQRQAMARDCPGWRNTVLEANVHRGL
jgi:hypothetical protein